MKSDTNLLYFENLEARPSACNVLGPWNCKKPEKFLIQKSESMEQK